MKDLFNNTANEIETLNGFTNFNYITNNTVDSKNTQRTRSNYDDTKSMLNGSNTNVSKIVYYYQVEGYDYLIISINQKRLGREQYVTPLVSLIALKTFTIGKSNDQ